MSEVQETRTDREYEQVQKPQESSSKTRKVYILGAAFVAILLLFTSINIMISATSPNIPTVIEPGSMVGDASFIIFVDGVTYYAKNGTTGGIDYSGTNATTVIQDAIDVLPSGGKIHLKDGIYLLSVGLVFSSSFVFEGEGYGTILRASAIGVTLVTIGPTSAVSGFAMSDLTVGGESFLGTTGIKLVNANHGYLSNMYIGENQDWGVDCIFALANTFVSVTISWNGNVLADTGGLKLGASTTECNANNFYGCYFQGNINGIKLFRGGQNTFVNCPIEGNWFSGVYAGSIPGSDGPIGTVFDSCWFELNNQGHGVNKRDIMFDNGTAYNSIRNCVFSGSDVDYSIYIHGSSWFNELIGGRSYSQPAYIDLSSGHYGLMDSSIFVTENHEIVSITGAVNSVTVNHHLNAIPTIVTVTVNNTGAGNYSVSSITSTQFVISFTNQPGANTWSFYWYAEV